MKASGQAAKGKQVRRLCRTVTTAAVSAALCLGPTACGGNDLLGGSEADRSSEAGKGQRAQPKPTEKSVRAFYARASKAYRDGDGHQLCRMTQRGHANAMVKQAAAAGLGVSTCPELWQFVFNADPQGYKDRISNVSVRGKTATFLSGNDPWRLRWIHGEWLIVRS